MTPSRPRQTGRAVAWKTSAVVCASRSAVMADDSVEAPPERSRTRPPRDIGCTRRFDSMTERTEDGDRTYRLFIGQLAERKHAPVGVTAPHGQGFRLLVTDRSASLYGETGLATSYAIYELLHRIGCRWFFPGTLGEVLPAEGPIALPATDERRTPSTVYRGVWYADDAWKRRNRQGGLHIEAGRQEAPSPPTSPERRNGLRRLARRPSARCGRCRSHARPDINRGPVPALCEPHRVARPNPSSRSNR